MIISEVLQSFGNNINFQKIAESISEINTGADNVMKMPKKIKTKMPGKVKKPEKVPTTA